jgi:hypothetical protein
MTLCAGSCVDTSSDAANCGSCGHDCQGGICLEAVCQPVTLASGQIIPDGIAVDATSVYWTNLEAVMKVGLGGGTLTTLYPSGMEYLTGPIAVNATSVYWPSYVDPTNNVMTMGLDGGTVTTLSSDQDTQYGIAVDATSVYWTNYVGGTVVKLELGRGTPTTLASGQINPYYITVDATSVYWTQGTSDQDAPPGTVMKVGLNGGTPITLASGQRPVSIAVDATSVYWTNPGADSVSGSVMKVAK